MLPFDAVKDNSFLTSQLLAENNSFVYNQISMRTEGWVGFIYHDFLIATNNTNPFTYFHKWRQTKDIDYLIKSADMKLTTSMLYLINIYTTQLTYNLDQAVHWYGQLKKYYIDNTNNTNNTLLNVFSRTAPHGFIISAKIIQLLETKYKVRHMNNPDNNILGEYEIINTMQDENSDFKI